MTNESRAHPGNNPGTSGRSSRTARIGVTIAAAALFATTTIVLATTRQSGAPESGVDTAANKLAPSSVAQQSSCANCHFANLNAPARDHLSEWDLSPHGRNDIGCESCHGGDASTFEPFRAHREILGGRNPASPTNPRNLPRTCGSCHSDPFVQFQRSRHKELLDSGDERGPTCSTCHGTVGAHLLSPRALASQCASCHGPDGVAPRPDHAAESRFLLESINAVRALLDEAEAVTGQIQDAQTKASLEYDLRQAEVPMLEAVTAGHAFRFEIVEDRLATARQRAQALLERLAALLD